MAHAAKPQHNGEDPGDLPRNAVNCVPLFWRDGALRVKCAAGQLDREPWTQAGAENGVLVDTGSKDLVLHSNLCEPCGAASNATHTTATRIDTKSEPPHVHKRSLGDGQEWMTKHCEEVYMWTGRAWKPMSGMFDARACIDLMSVIHRVPRRGFEGVSTSRAGTAGLGPTSKVFGCCIALQIDIPDADVQPSGRVELRAGKMSFARSPDPRAALRDVQEFISTSTTGALRICPCPSSQCSVSSGHTYKALVHEVTCGRTATLAHPPRYAVVDTGSTYLYVPHHSWHLNRTLLQSGNDVQISVKGIDPTTRAAAHHTFVVKPFAIRKLDERMPLPSDVWILGALALNHTTMVVCPETAEVIVCPNSQSLT